ncbi:MULTISPECIES: DUF4278 domain-containing protein [Prochlorococcus]|uniref:DUF4278 domain-containing protein n=1 Tax=Prochlorococcus TaxID=1218 RepID=UPI0009078DF1|nr:MULTISPECIES: DUF4278 domain-containing protein [Prochlorococcus]
MTTLTYRGKAYVQSKGPSRKELLELTYRRNVYTTRKQEAAQEHSLLTYRGVNYQN